jgi:FkbM family methyltransferase
MEAWLRIIERILTRPEFRERPLVLVDIGASGQVHAKWKPIAKHSVCVAFDADDREMAQVRTESGAFRALHVYNRVVTAANNGKVQFYLTKSPFCSSSLQPTPEKLQGWRFADLFRIDRVVTIPAITLRAALEGLKLDYVDWLKCDSQGTDLRLLQSLGPALVNRLLAAELEPGIIDAYEGEDDLGQVLSYMRTQPFWLSDIQVKGTQRISGNVLKEGFPEIAQRYLGAFLRQSPAWAELSFLNSFQQTEGFGTREFLAGWIFAMMEKQYGFAVELADQAVRRFNDPIYKELQRHAIAVSKQTGYLRLPGRALRAVATKILSKVGVS